MYIRKGKEELENERFWNAIEEQRTSISEDELDKASIGLGLSPLHNFDGNPISRVSVLKEWVVDVVTIQASI
jgi:hypothetical protein